MAHKKPHKILRLFFLILTPIFFLSLDAADIWKKNIYIIDRHSHEHFLGISVDADGNPLIWTVLDNGEMCVSVCKNLTAINKIAQKIWYNIDAGISKQPVTLTNFSAGGVKKWTVIYTAIWATKEIGPRPQVTIEGNLWGIFAPDPKNKRTLKLLYKSINGKDGIQWQQEETLTKLQKYPSIVSATNDGAVFVLCDDGVYKRYADGSWLPLVQSQKQVSSSKTPTTNDKTDKTATTKKTTTQKQPKLKYIAAVNKDLIYGLSEKNQVLVWEGQAWNNLDKISPKSDIKQIAVSPNNIVYCVANDGKVYFFAEKELAWRPLGFDSIWNVQQIAASKDRVFAWTAELYKQALMKNQSGLTASDQGAIGIAASAGLTAGLILSPIGLLAAGVISIAASVLSRPSLHEIYEWMGELPTPPEPKELSKKEETPTTLDITKQPAEKITKPVIKTAPVSSEKITEDVTAKLLKELEAINKQSETKATPKEKITPKQPTTPTVEQPKVVTTPPAETPTLAPTDTEPETEIEDETEETPTEATQTIDTAPTTKTAPDETKAEETEADETEETTQEFDPLTALGA